MKHYWKKVLSLVLTVAMLSGLICVPVSAATVHEGTNGKTIYMSIKYTSDAKGTTEVTEVGSGDNVFAFVNFFNNPVTVEDTIQAYDLCVGFDSEAMEMTGTSAQLAANIIEEFAEGVVYAAWANTKGILAEDEDLGEDVLQASGCLFRLRFQAKKDLTLKDLQSIKLIAGDTVGTSGTIQTTQILDGDKETFKVVQTPALSVTVAEDAKFYTSDAAKDIIDRAVLSAVMINADGRTTPVTLTADDIDLPSGGLKEGKNTITVEVDGYECKIIVDAELDELETLSVTGKPAKLVFTSGEKLDPEELEDGELEDLKITAKFESDKKKTVDLTDCEIKLYKDGNEVSYQNGLTVVAHDGATVMIAYGGMTAEVCPLKVNKIQVEIPIAVTPSDGYVYNGSEQTFEVGIDNDSHKALYTISADPVATNAGTYNFAVTLKDPEETEWAEDFDGKLTWTIKAKKVTPTVVIDPASYEYTGSAITPTSIEVKDGTVVIDKSEYAVNITNNVNYGTATVTVTDKADGNYEITTATGTFSITKKQPVITIADPAAITYDGSAVTAGTADADLIYTYTGDGDVSVKWYDDNNGEKGSARAAAPSDAGTYWVGVSAAASTNCEAVTEVTKKFTISPKEVELYWSIPANLKYTSGNLATLISATYNGSTKADLKFNGETEIENVGDYTVTASESTGNYTFTNATNKVTVAPAEVTVASVAVDAKKYDGTTAATGTINLSGVYGGDEVSATGTLAWASANAGTTTVNVTGIALTGDDAKNYVLKDTTFQATAAPIAKSQICVEYAADAKTLLSKQVVDGAKEYTYDLSTIAATVDSGMSTGTLSYAFKANGSYISNAAVNGSTLSFTVAEPQEAGVKTSVTVTVSSQNFVDVDVEIPMEFKNKTGVTVSLADITVTYGTSYAPAGVYAGTTDATSKWTYTYSDFAGEGQPTEVGTYTITATYEDDIPDGEIPGHIGTATATLTINKADLTVVWDSASYTYTGKDQIPTATATFKGEAVELNVTGAQKDAGENYTATAALVKAADLNNFNLKNTTKTFAIAPKSIAAVWGDTVEFTYDGAAHAPTATATGVEGETVTLAVGGAKKDAGTYTATASIETVSGGQAKAENYTLTNTTKSFTVKPLAVTLEWTDASGFIYKVGEEKTVTATVTNKVTGDTVNVTAYTGNKATDAGTYTAKATALDNANYTLIGSTTATYEWIIKPQTVALTWSGNAERPYDGKASNVTAKIEGDDTLTVKVTGGTAVNAGTHTATATVNSKNYAPTEESKTCTYVILQVERNLTVEDTMVLVPGALTGKVTITNCDDLDKSAEAGYTSNDTAVVKVNDAGQVTALGNGKTTVTVTVPETTNYKAATATVTVSAVVDPVTAVTVSGGSGLTAEIDGTTVKVAGTTDDLSKLAYTVTPAAVDGVTVEVSEVADGKFTVTVNGGDPITYKIDTSDVTVMPTDVTVKVESSDNLSGIENALPQSVVDKAAEAARAAEAKEATIKVVTEVVDGALKTTYTITVNGTESAPAVLPEVTQPVDLTIPTELTGDVYLKDSKGNYIPAESVSGGVATFNTDYLNGAFTLETLTGTVAITFNFEDGSEQTVTYAVKDIGTAFPADSVYGSNFKGWEINGKIYTALTEELLASDLDASEPLTAESVFERQSSGGGGTATYVITVKDTDNGDVKVSKKYSAKGKTITITVDPDEGYELGKLIVTDKNGDKVKVKSVGDNKYTFKMPASKVTVKATFVKADEEEVETSFSDVAESDSYFNAVKWAVAEGVTTGYADGTFRPSNTVTRAQAVTFLWRAMGEPKPETTAMPFTDVPVGSYYYDAVLWAVENGITTGMTATTFVPDKTISRAQTITFLWRTAKMEGYDVSVGEETNILSYTDAATIGAYAIPAMQWACGEEILNSYADGTLRPNEGCSRAQTVTFLYRFLG